ncbi:hypothetical protein DPK65_02535 [Salmonella enterica subsp. enterica]|nr:hypothetical protein [Salmonella enterica subsp. enterica]ECJ4518278.1 hypothetical protein [Salmonella enterica subsp. enterica]
MAVQKNTLSKRDAQFARAVAAGGDSPGALYAKSRGREYRGFNDDLAAENLLQNDQITNTINGHRRRIIDRDIVSRQEVLIDLTRRYRAPTAAQLYQQITEITTAKGSRASKAKKIAALDFSGVTKIKDKEGALELQGYDMGLLAQRIMNLSGIDCSKPITDEGKRRARRTLDQIFADLEAGK